MSGAVEDFIDDPIGTTVNVVTNVGTAGLVGYDKSAGGFTPGVAGEKYMEGAKELTGANAAEEANDLARQQFEQQSADALKARKDGIAANQRNEIALSNSAGSRSSNVGTPQKTSKAITGDVSDFLGI